MFVPKDLGGKKNEKQQKTNVSLGMIYGNSSKLIPCSCFLLFFKFYFTQNEGPGRRVAVLISEFPRRLYYLPLSAFMPITVPYIAK